MSGHSRPDEAARLEVALTRIAQAAARRPALHTAAPHATSPGGLDKAELAARLDGLIAELRILLGPQDF
jgi:hypothetical protein